MKASYKTWNKNQTKRTRNEKRNQFLKGIKTTIVAYKVTIAWTTAITCLTILYLFGFGACGIWLAALATCGIAKI